MNKQFLLNYFSIFDGSSLIDNIRQAFLDMQANTDEESIQNFLDQSLSYLCKDYMDKAVAEELLPAISFCFSRYPKYSLPFIDKFLNFSKKNEYLIITSISILFALSTITQQIDFTNHHNFIDECLKEIYPQINSPNSKLTLFDHVIPIQFQNTLILNILTTAKLTKEQFLSIFPYIFKTNFLLKNNQIDFFIQKSMENGFIKVPQITEVISQDLMTFIANHKIGSLNDMSFDTLLFLSQIVCFTKSGGKIEIECLNQETVFPIIAIALIYHNTINCQIAFLSEKVFSLLTKAIKSTNHKISQLSINSFEFILNNLDDLESKKIISNEYIIEMIITLACKLIHDETVIVDNFFILTLLFNKLSKVSDLNEQLKNFIEKDGEILLNYIFKNLSEITKCQILPKLNLEVFNQTMIINYIKNKFLTEKDTFQIIYFLENFCSNQPKFNFIDDEVIKKVVQQKIEEKNWNDFLLITSFIKKQDLELQEEIDNKIPYNVKFSLFEENLNDDDDISIDELLSCILTDSLKDQIRSNQLFQILFKKMMKDEELRKCYLLYYIDFKCDGTYNMHNYLADFLHFYSDYHDAFLYATKKRFYLLLDYDLLVFNKDFDLFSLPIPEFGVSIVSKLFEYTTKTTNFQIFWCLKNFASFFPFLFTKYSERIFEIVIQQFNHFYLAFNQNINGMSLELVKTAYSALSFLFSTLKMPSIFDDFIIWTFKNIQSFNNSQVLCIMIVLNYVYDFKLKEVSTDDNDKTIRIIEVSTLLSNIFIGKNYTDVIINLYERKDKDKIFDDYYHETISKLLMKIANSLNNMQIREKFTINLDLNSDRLLFNHYRFLGRKLPILQIIEPIQSQYFPKQFTNFIIDTDYIRDFWIPNIKNYNSIDTVLQVNELVCYTFNKEIKDISLQNDFKDQSDSDLDFLNSTSDRMSIFIGEYQFIIDFILLTANDKNLSILYNVIYNICNKAKSEYNVQWVLAKFAEFDKKLINGSDSAAESQIMCRLADILCIFIDYNIMRVNKYDAYNILSKVLTPKWRSDKLLLKKIIDVMRCSDSTPISMIHFCSFDILNNGIIYERDLSVILNICDIESKKHIVYNYYKHYSDLGSDDAMTIYGYLLWKGRKNDNENPEFIEYIKKASDLGNAAAIALMGLYFETGEGVEVNIQKRNEYIMNGVQKGSDFAINIYALDLIYDHHIEKNEKKGIYYLKKAIVEDNSNSLLNLGMILIKDNDHIYFDIQNNAEEGGKYIKKAADRGNIIAMKYFAKYKMVGVLPKNILLSYIYFVKLVNKCDDEFAKKIIFVNPNMQKAEYRNMWLEKAYKFDINKQETENLDLNFLNLIEIERNENERDEIERNEIERNEIERDEIERNEIERNEIERDEIERNEIERDEIERNEIERDEIERNEIESNESGRDEKECDESGRDEIKRNESGSDEKENDKSEHELLELADKGDLEAMTSIHEKIYKDKKINYESYEYFAQEASKYEQILLDYKQDNNKIFVDDNFKPFKHWKRIEELYDAPLFQKDLIDTSFVQQEQIGNCCFVSALSKFSSHKELIPGLFNCKLPNEILGVVPNSINLKCGAVVVYVIIFGRKTPILIDTLIPCDEYGEIILSHPIDKNKSPWFTLFEKAMIKAYGSFTHIIGISFQRAIYSIHLSYYKTLKLRRFGSSYNIHDYINKDKLCTFNYDKINEYLNKGFNIEASEIDQTTKKHGFVLDNGIIHNHSYLICNAKSYQGINFICLRNPWGHQEWEGRYSRNSKIMSSDVKKFLDYDNCPSGMFWISENDFFKHFSKYCIVKPVPQNWHVKMIPFKLKYVHERKTDYSDHQTFAIRIQQEIPKGKKCTIHFIIENKRRLNTYDETYYMIFIAQVNGEKINLEKIKDMTKFASFSHFGKGLEEFTFDVTNCDEAVSVTLFQYYGDPAHNYCYVNVVCKYQFIMYDIDQPDVLYPDISQ